MWSALIRNYIVFTVADCLVNLSDLLFRHAMDLALPFLGSLLCFFLSFSWPARVRVSSTSAKWLSTQLSITTTANRR